MQRTTIGLVVLTLVTTVRPAWPDNRPLPCCDMPTLATPKFSKAASGNKSEPYRARHPAGIAGTGPLLSGPQSVGYSSGARGLRRVEGRSLRNISGMPDCGVNEC